MPNHFEAWEVFPWFINTLGIWSVRESSSTHIPFLTPTLVPKGKKERSESDLLKYAFNLPETGLVAKER